jgi:hypothetical protein
MSQGMIPAARSTAPVLAIGGVCGPAWAAGLRGFMAELAGSGSDVGSYGTFVQILLRASSLVFCSAGPSTSAGQGAARLAAVRASASSVRRS